MCHSKKGAYRTPLHSSLEYVGQTFLSVVGGTGRAAGGSLPARDWQVGA